MKNNTEGSFFPLPSNRPEWKVLIVEIIITALLFGVLIFLPPISGISPYTWGITITLVLMPVIGIIGMNAAEKFRE